MASKEGSAAPQQRWSCQVNKAGLVRDGQHQPLPHWFLHRLEAQAVLWSLPVLCGWGTAASPTQKQQLPVWLRLDDCKCQQTKEHKSRFIFISSSTVSWYFNALQVLIKDLVTRNLRGRLRAGSIRLDVTAQIPQHFLHTTEGTLALPHLQNFSPEEFSSWWRIPELLCSAHRHWLCSDALGVRAASRGSFLQQGEHLWSDAYGWETQQLAPPDQQNSYHKVRLSSFH